MINKIIISIALALISLLIPLATMSDNEYDNTKYQERPEPNFLQEGIKLYNAGKYMHAAGSLGAAMSSEFSNPVLHYYLANSFARLKQNEAAIREYRIAYALDPNSKLAEYCKTALFAYGVDELTASKPAKILTHQDDIVNQTLTRIRQQLENAKANTNSSHQLKMTSLDKQKSTDLDRVPNRREITDSIGGRRGRFFNSDIQKIIEEELNKQKEAIEKQHGHKARAMNSEDAKRNSNLEQSASNLQDLLTQPVHPGNVKLVPTGTNLYIRNYKSAPATNQNKNK
jgi:tetratricopeptide (TPR) repeat protein